jgi:prepilin-type processing-associated H-X9-DG protein
VFFLFLVLIAFPPAVSRTKSRQFSCLSSLKQIGLGTMMYTQDYDDCLPPASEWQTNLHSYVKNDQVFICPEAVAGKASSHWPDSTIAYNRALDMLPLKRLADPANTITTYDSITFQRNANDALTSLPRPGRHTAANNIGFADGHAKTWPDSKPLPQGQILPDTP